MNDWPGWLVVQALVLAELAAAGAIALAVKAGRTAVRHIQTRKEA
ncbi:hypothetical protein ACWD4O_38995 [Streptomyces sp. NPDC002623]